MKIWYTTSGTPIKDRRAHGIFSIIGSAIPQPASALQDNIACEKNGHNQMRIHAFKKRVPQITITEDPEIQPMKQRTFMLSLTLVIANMVSLISQCVPLIRRAIAY
jgi:hypothetical protein